MPYSIINRSWEKKISEKEEDNYVTVRIFHV